MRIYLDNCCLQRIWDDQTQPRIQKETEAIQLILLRIESGEIQLISSVALESEVQDCPDELHREVTQAILAQATDYQDIDDIIQKRANELQQNGVKNWDALHAAIAEKHLAALITTDDRFLKKLRSIPWRGKVFNPLDFVQEFFDEH